MKKLKGLCALLLCGTLLLSSCSTGSDSGMGTALGGMFGGIFGGLFGGGNDGGSNGGSSYQGLPLPENAFENTQRQAVIGSIVQTGDGNVYVKGSVPAPKTKSMRAGVAPEKTQQSSVSYEGLVTLEHAFGSSCYVSGYVGKSLYIIQDFGSLMQNKKGIGHKDGTVLLNYGEDGYYSISAMSENKLIVGNPTDESTDYYWEANESYRFGYMVYNEEKKELVPMYAENNLRFYSAGYFINGVAMVSIKQNDKILFGIIDEEGNYVVEPQYEMMADESFDDVVIVAKNATPAWEGGLLNDTCGRMFVYDSNLMTYIQSSRWYECKSQSVGLINTLTGESVLPCNYSFIERVMDDTYFLVDNDGASFFYNVTTKSFAAVEEGVYSYFNHDWMLYILHDNSVYFADKNLTLYDIGDVRIDLTTIVERYRNATQGINTNVISAARDEQARLASEQEKPYKGIDVGEYKGSATTLTIVGTGDAIENVTSFTQPYNGGMLYTMENSLYRYDMQTRKSVMVETGYGNYTQDYVGAGRKFYTTLSELDEGVYILRYNIEDSWGRSYHMIIVNDLGEVLFETSVNSVYNIGKNYLGKYDEGVYELAGNTKIEDNYFLTRDDGSHFLIQFVRGGAGSGSAGTEGELKHTRTVDASFTIDLLSPFKLDFADGSQISVCIDGQEISAENYVYDSQTQSLKVLGRAFEVEMLEKMRSDGYKDILVTAGQQSVTLKINVSPYAFRF